MADEAIREGQKIYARILTDSRMAAIHWEVRTHKGGNTLISARIGNEELRVESSELSRPVSHSLLEKNHDLRCVKYLISFHPENKTQPYVTFIIPDWGSFTRVMETLRLEGYESFKRYLGTTEEITARQGFVVPGKGGFILKTEVTGVRTIDGIKISGATVAEQSLDGKMLRIKLRGETEFREIDAPLGIAVRPCVHDVPNIKVENALARVRSDAFDYNIKSLTLDDHVSEKLGVPLKDKVMLDELTAQNVMLEEAGPHL